MRKVNPVVLVSVGLLALAVLGALGWRLRSSMRRSSGNENAAPSGRERSGAADRSDAPVISLWVHDAQNGQVFAGWPLVVRASIRHPQAFRFDEVVKPMLLSGPKGSWQEAVHLEVGDGRGQHPGWPFHSPAVSAESVTLDARTGIEWVWWLTAEETQAVPSGTYTLVARLDTSGGSAPGGWTGNARSDAVTIAVAREPSLLSPEQQTGKELLLARVERLEGNTAGAVSRLKALLAREPTNTNVLVAVAALVAEAGQTEEAIGLYDRAIGEAAKSAPEGSDPPAELIRARQALRARLRAGIR